MFHWSGGAYSEQAGRGREDSSTKKTRSLMIPGTSRKCKKDLLFYSKQRGAYNLVTFMRNSTGVVGGR